jgi:hypothetical protein
MSIVWSSHAALVSCHRWRAERGEEYHTPSDRDLCWVSLRADSYPPFIDPSAMKASWLLVTGYGPVDEARCGLWRGGDAKAGTIGLRGEGLVGDAIGFGSE